MLYVIIWLLCYSVSYVVFWSVQLHMYHRKAESRTTPYRQRSPSPWERYPRD